MTTDRLLTCWNPALALATLLLTSLPFTAGCGGNRGSTGPRDTGPAVTDSGTPPTDSGTPPTDSGPAPICDPLGNWNLTVTWGAGDCFTGANSWLFTVTDNLAGGFFISGSDPATTITGTITDLGAGGCRLSAIETDPDPFGDGMHTGSASYNLTADAAGVITGNGSISVSGAIPCSQAFTVTGMLM